MELSQELEFRIKSAVIPYLETGRPGWNIPHTIATVYWMKRLIEKEGGDPRILVTTMYEHDIGYYLEKTNPELYHEGKKAHMNIGASASLEMNKKLGFSGEEIDEIFHLISVHDKIRKLSTFNEILVMEADTLGQIDYMRTSTTFRKEKNIRYYTIIQEDRFPLFQTKTGIKYANLLFEKSMKITESCRY